MKVSQTFAAALIVWAVFLTARPSAAQQGPPFERRTFVFIPPAENNAFAGFFRARDSYSRLAFAAGVEHSGFGTTSFLALEKAIAEFFVGGRLSQTVLEQDVAFFVCGAQMVPCEEAADQWSFTASVGYDSDLIDPYANSAFWNGRFRLDVGVSWILNETVDRNDRRTRAGIANPDAVEANLFWGHSFRVRRSGWRGGLPVGYIQFGASFNYPLHNFEDSGGEVLDRDEGVVRVLFPDDGNWVLNSRLALWGNISLGLFFEGGHLIDIKPELFVAQHFQRVGDVDGLELENNFELNAGPGLFVTFTIPRVLGGVLAATPGVELVVPITTKGNLDERDAAWKGLLFIELRR